MGGPAVLARSDSSGPARRPRLLDRPEVVRGLTWWPALWGASLGLALFAIARQAMPDDALITLSFARNLAEHGCWCLSAGVETNTATSPLNVWLLAGLIALTGHAFWAAAAVLAASLGAVAMWLRHIGGPLVSLLGTAAIATSPLLASAVGMETVLAVAVLVGVVRYAADERWVLAGVMCGLSWLARPDLVIAAVAAISVLALARRQVRLLASLAIGALVAAPWTVFSWFYFGSAFANSVTVKWANGAWNGGRTSLTSLGYFFGGWPALTVVTSVFMVAGVVAVLVGIRLRAWPATAFGTAALAHLGALASTSTPPTAYYLGPSFAGLALAFVILSVRSRVGVALSVLLVAAGIAVLVGNGPWWERGFAPIRQNWATNSQYEAIARELPAGFPIMSTTEIGALAFYCHDRCQVIDYVLADPGRVDGYVARWQAAHPTIAAINYRFYNSPAPIPVLLELQFGFREPGSGPAWPITRQPGMEQWARLVPARDPLVLLNR